MAGCLGRSLALLTLGVLPVLVRLKESDLEPLRATLKKLEKKCRKLLTARKELLASQTPLSSSSSSSSSATNLAAHADTDMDAHPDPDPAAAAAAGLDPTAAGVQRGASADSSAQPEAAMGSLR